MVSPGGVRRIPQDTCHFLLRNWNEECEGATRCSQWNKAAVYWEEIMNLAILPLAITMLAGPQIMSAIICVTSVRPVRTSVAFMPQCR
jgi:hypothetical protein